MIRVSNSFPIVAVLFGSFTLGVASPARAVMQLEITDITDGVTLPLVTDSATPGLISESSVSFDIGKLLISTAIATSNSASSGPGVAAQLGIGSVFVSNTTGSTKTIVLTVTDVGFTPEGSGPSGMDVYNSASVTYFKGSSQDSVTFQTFVYDGANSPFVTTANDPDGPNDSKLVATDPVILSPAASGATTRAEFNPQSSQFSMTDVMTITLASGSSIFTTSGISVVHAPEPGALALVISALPMTLLLWRSKRPT
jgi:hypothetical protein